MLAQLSNKIQHGLRAYTPAEQKAVKAAAQSFRPNPNFDSEQAILELGTGEALVSFLDEDGRPSIVEYAKILPPQCLMAAADDVYMQVQLNNQKDLMSKYGQAIDRESAYEMVAAQKAAQAELDEIEAQRAALEKERAEWEAQKAKEEEAARKKAEKEAERAAREAERKAAAEEKARQRQQEQFAKRVASVGTSMVRTAGTTLVRNILGSLIKK